MLFKNTIISVMFVLFITGCSSSNYSKKETGKLNIAYIDDGSKKLLGDEIFTTIYSGFSEQEGMKPITKDRVKRIKGRFPVRWESESLFQETKKIAENGIKKIEVHPWDAAHAVFLTKTQSEKLVVAVEPDFDIIGNDSAVEEINEADEKTSIAYKASPFWPNGNNINWHQGNDFSELSDARKTVSNINDRERVLIAHLDTGYNPNDKLKPPKFDEALSNDFVANKNGVDDKVAGHGVRTLSSLAGGKIDIVLDGKRYNDYLGGNPHAKVFEYRIHKSSPVHLNSRNMAKAIFSAVKNKADLISLSAGGMPSFLQRDAVNHAYENGTAIIAATGNHFVVPLFGWKTPNMVGFPARYNRTLAVAGVTYDNKPYTDSACIWCLLTEWPWNWGSWMLRGNAGPASIMKGNSISAYSPNIAYSTPGTDGKSRIGLDGAGASHATTQVAAAASIWLQKNKNVITNKGKWRSWEKVESVYQALMSSAAHGKDIKEYSMANMGEGILRAKQALSFTYKKVSGDKEFKYRKESNIGAKWILELFTRSNIPYISSWANENVIKMLGLELAQVIYQEKYLFDDYIELNQCMESNQKLENCKSFKDILITNIINEADISNTLKNALVTSLI